MRWPSWLRMIRTWDLRLVLDENKPFWPTIPASQALIKRLGARLSASLFFPRVQTPCGHGAQVIVEGREERQMVENGTKTPKNQPKTKHPSPQADSTIL